MRRRRLQIPRQRESGERSTSRESQPAESGAVPQQWSIPPESAASISRRDMRAHLSSAGGLVLRVGSILLLFCALELLFTRITRLPERSYTRPVFLIDLLARLATPDLWSVLAIAGIVLSAAAAIRWRSGGPAWSDLEHGMALRSLIVTVAAVLAWVFGTYAYNYYYDRPHHLERALVLALVPLVFWRPVFSFVLLLLCFSIGWQFAYPIGGFSWAAPILLLRVILLFAAFWFVRAFTPRAHTADFLFLLFCLVAGHYWVSGLGKLQLGWLGADTIGYLLPATYANGWLVFLPTERIAAITRVLVSLNWPMKLATLLVECGALFALWRRGSLRWLLYGAIALHAGIFLLTGIFFWHWIVLDALLIGLFLRARRPALPFFTTPHFALSLLLIGLGSQWFRAQRLAWRDAPVSYSYRIYAEAMDGRSYALPPAILAPYDYQFTLSPFRYLVPAPRLPITWGAAPPHVAAALRNANTADRVFALEAEIGENRYSDARAETFDEFVRMFVTRWHAGSGATEWWRPLKAPPLLWTFPRADPHIPPDRIVRLVVREKTSLFDGTDYLEIREITVRTLDVAAAPPFPFSSGRGSCNGSERITCPRSVKLSF